MADARYNRMNNQAPAQTQLEASKPTVGRSVFDFSTIHSGNTMLGLLAPVDCFDVVPNEDIDINLSALLEFRNPTTRPILNGFRVYFHAYVNYLVDLWEGAKNFLDAGRTGKISLSRPNLIWHVEHTQTLEGVDITFNADSCTPLSLLNFLGLSVTSYTENTGIMATPLCQFKVARDFYNMNTGTKVSMCKSIGYHTDFFPADCAFAYQRNWRDYYSNENLLQNNKYWFPDNEDHFILSYSCENAVCVNYEGEDLSNDTESQYQNLTGLSVLESSFADAEDNYDHITPEPNNPRSVATLVNPYIYPNLSGIKFRQFKGDRFTTALPFPDLIRGDIPVLSDFNGDNGDLEMLTRSGDVIGLDFVTPETAYPVYRKQTIDGTKPRFFSVNNSLLEQTSDFVLRVKNGSSNITMNDIRALETMTVFRERMARTSGEYNDMIEAQYGYNPKHHIRKGDYIGGFYQDFSMSSVTQQSESASTPLGTKAGQGVSQGQGNIGHVHTRDFGWIQIYMSVVSDVFYTQGVPRMFSKKTQLQMYFPIFNNLEPQAIENQELFVSGTSATDHDVFAYEDRYAEYKSRPNRVSGFMSLSPTVAVYDSAKIMARRFVTTPSLNSQFVTMVPENVDMNVFSVTDEPPFDFQVGIGVRRVFPGPYTAIPGAMSSNLHA